MSPRRTSSPWGCRCRCHGAWPCSPGPSATRRPSWRTTTTASSARGRPIEPLQTLDRAGRVVYVGSFSKTLLATLRLGFVVSASLRRAVRTAKLLTDWHTPLPFRVPWPASSSRACSPAMSARCARSSSPPRAGRRRPDPAVRRPPEVIPSAVGLHLAATAPGVSAMELDGLLGRASVAGVELLPLSLYAVDTPPQPGLDLRLRRHPHRPHRPWAGLAAPLLRGLSRSGPPVTGPNWSGALRRRLALVPVPPARRLRHGDYPLTEEPGGRHIRPHLPPPGRPEPAGLLLVRGRPWVRVALAALLLGPAGAAHALGDPGRPVRHLGAR